MSKCAISRKVWNLCLHPLQYSDQEMLGFVDRDLNNRNRVFLACSLFLVFEAYRFWRHHGRHMHNHDASARTVLLHAAGALHGARSSEVKQYIAQCTSALNAGIRG